LAVVIVTALPGGSLVALAALAAPNATIPAATVVAIVLFVVGASLGVSVLSSWPSARVHSRRWLTLSGILGTMGAYLTANALGPWPDLLSDEVIRGGSVRFCVEVVKTFVPWLAGAVVAFAALRYDPVASRRG
jgi:hypothetical protein